MTVRNRATLVEGDEAARRADAVGIIEDALAAVAPDRLLEGVLERSGDVVTIDGRTYDLDATNDAAADDAAADDVFVIGAGKGAGALASAVLDRLGDAVSEALVVEKDTSTVDPAAFESSADAVSVMEAGHPIPNEASLAAGERALALADRAGPDDLVVCCITGGASALLAAPDGIELDAMAGTTDRLLRAGAPIEDVNAVRKHLSAIKGGALAERLAPATVESLIVVDEVAGDPWGPTAPDATTYADALDVLDRYGLREAVPPAVSDRLERGAVGDRSETLDTAAIADLPVRNVVLADAASVCLPAAEAARERGYEPLVLSTRIEGEASEVGLVHAGIATDVVESGRPAEPPMALVTGGETTVTVDGEDGDSSEDGENDEGGEDGKGGKGGPNQETALGFARGIDGWSGIVGAFVGTDGTDGPTELAGAMATGETRRRASEAGVPISDALAANDAARTVRELDDAIVTGPTDTNLMDLRIVLVGGDDPE